MHEESFPRTLMRDYRHYTSRLHEQRCATSRRHFLKLKDRSYVPRLRFSIHNVTAAANKGRIERNVATRLHINCAKSDERVRLLY